MGQLRFVGSENGFSKTTLIILCSLLLAVPAAAQDSRADFETRMRESLEGRFKMLRGFYTGDRVVYDEYGGVLEGTPGLWSADGIVKIERVRLEGNELLLECRRVGAFFRKGKAGYDTVERRSTVTLRLRQREPFMDSAVDAQLRSVFLHRDDNLDSLLPPYMAQYMDGSALTSQSRFKNDAVEPRFRVLKAGSGVSSPKPVHSPDPEYSEAARANRTQGTVVVSVIVTGEGRADAITILKSAKDGLDAKAAAGLMEWRFTPGVANGSAVNTNINIEIKFNLYDNK